MSAFEALRTAVRPYALDLGVPLVTARGAMRFRRGYLLEVETAFGAMGLGDAACFPGFGTSEDAVGVALGSAAADLVGVSFSEPDEIDRWLDARELPPEGRCALEVALLDLLAQGRGISLHALLAPNSEGNARTHRLVTTLDERGVPRGEGTYKLKLLGRLDEDDVRVARLRSLAGPDAHLRLDANGAHRLDDARRTLERLARHGVNLIEQPIAPGHLDEMATLRAFAHSLGIRVAADEDVSDEQSLAAVAATGAADVVVLKPMFVGGVRAAHRLAVRAMSQGLDVLVTHALESAVGRLATMHLAATLPGTHGLAWTPAEDVRRAPQPRGGVIVLPPAAGLGFMRPQERSVVTEKACPTISVPNPLAQSAMLRPDAAAVSIDGATLTYGSLAADAARFAEVLRQRGISAGARVALRGTPSPNWVRALHAIWWAGAVPCPLPHRATSAELEGMRRAMAAEHEFDADELDDALLRSTEAGPAESWRLDDERLVVGTSGSTGAPRAISLTTAQLAWNAFGSAMRLGHDLGERWLSPLPLHHVGGLSVLLRSAFAGTTAIIAAAFDASAVASALDSGHVTIVSLTPTMLERVLDARAVQPFPATLRAILVGGGPASEPLLDRCRAIGAPVALSWGMTEAASQIATRPPGDLGPIADGIPPLVVVTVASRDGGLVVGGPTVGGTLETRDHGEVIQGRVRVGGRIDDVIVRGGENIDPIEVERALLTHSDVSDCAVVGVPSRSHGEDVAAAVVLRRESVSIDELRAHARSFVAGYKVPTRFVVVAELPRTPLGKIARAAVAKLFEETDLRQPVEQPSRRERGLHAVERDAHVNEPYSRTHVVLPALSTQRVGEREGAPAESLEGDGDVDALVKTNGLHEVGLGAHERKANPVLGDERLDVRLCGEEQFLVGGVAHLVDATEEQNSRAIHLEEARRDAMNERHDHERRQQP